ncbi:MAG: SusD/RagB family nutrient-binding outer membrane lipoprotein [Bacteroidales bacterium]|nr:SusD/RagB family nutrient-binding outer membrane lipoprotein [Bacteroidales bacterium]
MKKILKIKIILVLSLIIALVSCTKDWEEMNTNPNEPVEVSPTNILAYSLRYIADNFYDDWMDMNNFETYSGHLGKIQYIDEAQYRYREGTVNNAWRDIYTTMFDLQKVIDMADAEGDKNMKAVALTFQSFILQIATDTWKAIPYSDAMLGQQGNITPEYDSQEFIYDKLFENLKTAGDLFAQNGDDDLGEGDLLFNGNVGNWQKFCNSLRLRVAIRVSLKDPAGAKSHIEEILGDPGKYPIIASNNDDAKFIWPGVSPYKEPWAENFLDDGRDDHGMCVTLIDILKDYNDPRLPVYAQPAPSDGEYRGVVAGAVEGSFVMADISRIGVFYRENPSGFTPFMRYPEIQFIIAEAAVNGWNTNGIDAKTAYDAGITASLQENGIAQADIDTYLLDSNVAWDGDVNKIYMQKWISLFKQGHEAWAECRRTDIPLMGEAPGSPYQSHNRPPFRYPYPTDEFNLNGANIGQVTGGIIDHFWGQQMFWDVRTGVH